MQESLLAFHDQRTALVRNDLARLLDSFYKGTFNVNFLFAKLNDLSKAPFGSYNSIVSDIAPPDPNSTTLVDTRPFWQLLEQETAT